MYNGMMDPEMIKLAQEQMSRISPSELSRIQQMMSNPEIMKLATESMKNMRTEDLKVAAEQLKNTRPEEMADISEQMANASPEEIASMRARADAHITYELNGAEMLKKQGNSLHSQGKFSDAAWKYLLAKNNLKNIPVSKGRMLQLACSLNLMSCYLKARQYDECIKEGSEVLSYDANNVKALYRRGQAYREIGNLEAAVFDLTKAHEVSPDDETIADVLRDVNERFAKEGGCQRVSQRLVIEEITEEEVQTTSPEYGSDPSPADCSVRQPTESEEGLQRQDQSESTGPATTTYFNSQGSTINSETIRSFKSFVSNANPYNEASSVPGGVSPEMVKSASEMISKMPPEELQKMLEMASSTNGRGPDGLQSSAVPPEMVKTASEMIGKMSPEELNRMFEVALTFNGRSPFQTADPVINSTRSGRGESSASNANSNSRIAASTTSDLPTSTADLQEKMRNQMKDPAMRQMFSSMFKDMSPDMMANMSEQFGIKLSREEAAKAQQAMSSLSLENLDKMMRWVERTQRVAEGAKKTKNWLLGRPGMILAICMLILAIILHRLGYIGN
ncbi:outer envelope protein 61-like [Aristolochia californica]|uniref:outer envelope protein 61-like n=1 Tax=Aristolochia californica TaxID=171875 RepID=UPI0035DAE429